MAFRILILGGYGHFGARIARALARDAEMHLLIAGRHAERARGFAATLGAGAEGLALDASDPQLAAQLSERGVRLVIHTAGPFQLQRYDVAFAAAAAGAHYIDLADGRRFVCDFETHTDAAFRKVHAVGISGASTVPALSSAVVDALTIGWRHIDGIDICIAPAQGAPRGLATMRAVLGYCGEPIDVWLHGRWHRLHGWAAPTPVQFARMKPRLGALCDVPDLELFPARYAGVHSVMFRAALEVGLTQRALGWLAAARQARWIGPPVRWAPSLFSLARVFDWMGSALGGMAVRVGGLDAQGRQRRAAWHIAADRGHGPEIPCMAAILLARQLARGAAWSPGARACVGLLKLEAFEPEFRRWGMQTDIVDESAARASTRA
jgi:hypothetical protein